MTTLTKMSEGELIIIFRTLCAVIIENSPNPYAVGYAEVGLSLTDLDAIEEALAPVDAKVFHDHRHLPWLRYIAVGRPGAYCHVVWKPNRLKGIPGGMVLAFSDAELFLRFRHAIGSHLLRQGCLYTRIESRLLPRLPMISRELAGFRNKVFRSDTLTETDISNLYSEIVGLDL